MNKKSGIEILRLLAMFLVVTLHVLGIGGGLENVEKGTGAYCLLWLLEVIAYIAVNLFAFISGYVMYNRKMSYKRILSFVVKVFFYMLIIWLFTRMFGWHTTSLTEMISKSNPFNLGLWYVQSYIGLMVFIPVLNAFIQITEERTLLVFAGIVFVMFSVVTLFVDKDVFQLNNGYSTLWLCILYLGGGIIAKCKVDCLVSRWKWLFYWIISVFIIWGTKILVELISFRKFGIYEEYNALISYVSPFMVVATVCLFNVFSTVTISLPNWFYKISKCSFGVYLVHMHQILLARYISNKSIVYLEYSVGKMIVFVILRIICVFMVSLLVSLVLEGVYGCVIKLLLRLSRT